eukprot:GHVP01027509.1.p1 GENE.GHVP01027509.1~~GHVP01027509.1.p1  ORF type:complete len:140 (+),score=22.44 GHVP01027509.1:66-422(+)
MKEEIKNCVIQLTWHPGKKQRRHAYGSYYFYSDRLDIPDSSNLLFQIEKEEDPEGQIFYKLTWCGCNKRCSPELNENPEDLACGVVIIFEWDWDLMYNSPLRESLDFEPKTRIVDLEE